MRTREKFTRMFDALFQIEDITFSDVVLLSLILSLCAYRHSNEIYLKSKTLTKRFRRSDSQVKRMIKSLEDKRLIAVYSKGYGHFKMRHVQVLDERLLKLLGNVEIAVSVESHVESRAIFYANLNLLLAKDRISEQEARETTNIPYWRLVFYHLFVRALREIRNITISLDAAAMGYLRAHVTDGDTLKIGDIRRIIDGVKNVNLEGVLDAKSVLYRVMRSFNSTPENFPEAFTYERFERELGFAREVEKEPAKRTVSFESHMEEQWKRMYERQFTMN